MPARFHDQEVHSKLSGKRRLSSFLDNLVFHHRPEVKKVSLTYIFCTDEALLTINQQFLDHDTFTDIVTFDLSDKEQELTGELYISTERIAENAAKFKTTYQTELHRVIFHGALHLCGFKDKTKKDQEEMRGQEERCLQEWFHTNK
jgi:probable rRNA maturation factor